MQARQKISKHPMLKLICRIILGCPSRFAISKHPMLKLIVAEAHKRVKFIYFKTSHVKVNRKESRTEKRSRLISKHPMLKLISIRHRSKLVR